MKRLIVNGDDFGRAPGINQGILDAHLHGIVTSTTVMINFEHAAPGLDLLRESAPDLGVGLHVTLTAGAPALPPVEVASLVGPSGEFYPIQEWPAHYADFQPEHLQAEIAAQVERFIRLAGCPPDHLDSHHQAAYLHPAALHALLEEAARYRIPLRHSGLADDADATLRRFRQWLPGLADAFGPALIEFVSAVLDDAPAPFWPARLELGFFGERATLGDLLVILTTLPDDSLTEIMCHPGYPDDARAAPERDRRAEEVAHLTHRATLECIKAEGIELVTFGDVARPAR